jgi:hypothetical protein
LLEIPQSHEEEFTSITLPTNLQTPPQRKPHGSKLSTQKRVSSYLQLHRLPGETPLSGFTLRNLKGSPREEQTLKVAEVMTLKELDEFFIDYLIFLGLFK